MPFSAVYHPEVKARDIPKINTDVRQRIKKAIENRLLVAPQEYGQPLRRTLKGYLQCFCSQINPTAAGGAALVKLNSK